MSVTSLDDLRSLAARWFIVALWVHVPLVAGVAWLNGTFSGLAVALAVGFAAVATALWRLYGAGEATRYAIAVAMVGMVSLLVMRAAGPWQIDLHMYYFAALAMLAAFCDWRTIVVAAAVTALHHLVLNFALPWAVFPDGGSLPRVMLHAVIVILETGVLIGLTVSIAGLFDRAADAIEKAEAARAETDRLAGERAALELQSQEEKRTALLQLAERFESSVKSKVGGVETAMTEMRGQADGLVRTAESTDGEARAVATASAEMSHDVDTVAAAAEELAASISEISRRVTDSASLAREAVDHAAQTDARVSGLAEAAQKIGDVVKLITDIAEQTNLLALNATIEAARAGEAGKGFAVVASEVKNLATQTGKATEEIAQQIAEIQSATGGTVEAIRTITDVIQRLDENAGGIATAVEEQDATTRDISQTVQKAAAGTQHVATAIGRVTEAADRTGGAARTVREVADSMARETEALRHELDGFLDNLRAA
jgi:methyl-accepting chemotaxis protein